MSKQNAAAKEQQPETVLSVVKTEETKNEPANFRDISRHIAEETAIMERWRKLDQTEKKLDSFNVGSDTMRDTLNIEDSEGNEFQTTNSEIIAEVVELLKLRVSEKKTELEKELVSRRLAA
jgi:hypothetical protein